MSVYLSRLFLNNDNRAVRWDLGDCHRMHQRILKAFGKPLAGSAPRNHFAVLYRTESVEDSPKLTRVLIQSNTEPDWSNLGGGYLATLSDGLKNPSVRMLDAQYGQIQNGMRFIFRLQANPTKRISSRNPEREDTLLGKRVNLTGEADQLDWLQRKGQQHGFRLLVLDTPTNEDLSQNFPDVQTTHGEKIYGTRGPKQDLASMRLSFGSVLFNGHLVVIDKNAFTQALKEGIGSGKAFGFGLLSIASD